MDIHTALQNATAQLGQSDSPRLDAEVLLCHVLQCSRSHLFAWPEQILSARQIDAFESLLAQRIIGHPVAYLVGSKEFWSLPLHVNNATLIPRPDTEILVEQALKCLAPAENQQKVLDLGTGSGAIALAIASERPDCEVFGSDISYAALRIAKHNAERLKLHNTHWLGSDWFAALKMLPFDLIVSNPPYIASSDPHLEQGDLRFEPLSALRSGHTGLVDLEQIIASANKYLVPNGWLCLEHGYDQCEAVQHLLKQYGYTRIISSQDLGAQVRMSQAQAM